MTDKMLKRTAVFRRDFFETQGKLLTQLVEKGQSPKILLVTCSDSRILPEKLFGNKPGDLFVIRNVSNVIPPYIQAEIGAVSALEYAIHELKVGHLIILGHTDCGGIRSLDRTFEISQYPALSRWLEFIRPARREAVYMHSGIDPEKLHQLIVERNVVNQLQNAVSYPFMRQALSDNRLELHGWVWYMAEQEIRYYDPQTDTFLRQ